jgi:hypothetical protein
MLKARSAAIRRRADDSPELIRLDLLGDVVKGEREERAFQCWHGLRVRATLTKRQ